jgi:hypothetical protein
MRSYVYLQTTGSRVGFSAVRALKWKFASVDKLMCFLVPFSYELLTTTSERTFKWSFPSLNN